MVTCPLVVLRLADFLQIDRIGLLQGGNFLAGDLAGDTDGLARPRKGAVVFPAATAGNNAMNVRN